MKKIISVLSLGAIAFTSISTSVFAQEVKDNQIISGAKGSTEIVVAKDNKNAEVFSPNMEVRINGVLVNFGDQKPVIKNNRTLVPFRATLEAMGADVQWDEVNRTVRANQNGVGMVLEIGNKTALVGTQKVEMDVPAEIINGRTYVPLRFVSEGLGYEVIFNDENKDLYKIDINKSQEQMEKEKKEREEKYQNQKENVFDQFLKN